jgi:hypothetical protein
MGPFYFAYTGQGVAFDPEVHAVEDERIYAITIDHVEGGFASLKIDIRNPRVGLLAPGREVWAWLSYQADTGGPQAIFRGRLVALPDDLTAEEVTLEFIAQPPNYADLQAALAETLKVPPYWDEVWISGSVDDPNTVLEARPALYCIDRVTLGVSISDIINGEDGTEVFTEDDDFYDGMSVSYGSAPLTEIDCTATAVYPQQGSGDVDFTAPIVAAAGGIGNRITTLTAPALLAAWPSPGANIGGGWTVGDGFAAMSPFPTLFNLVKYAVPNTVDPTAPPISPLGPVAIITYQPTGPAGALVPVVKPSSQVLAASSTWQVAFPIQTLNVKFTGHYEASRSRSEVVEFRLLADVQAIVSDTGGADIEKLDLTTPSGMIDALTDFDLRSPSFFKTDRGQLAFQYVVAVARAKLLDRARCVDVMFDTTWERGLPMTLRKNVELHDDRLPGLVINGKVKEYKLTYSADSGVGAEIKIGCTVGHGGTVTADPGDGDYVDDDYCEAGYQTATGATLDLIPGEIVYEPFDSFVLDDDGVDLLRMSAARCLLNSSGLPEGATVIGTLSEQNAAIAAAALLNPPDPISGWTATPTKITVETVPVVGGPFATLLAVGDLTLKVQKTIDLEAPAAP